MKTLKEVLESHNLDLKCKALYNEERFMKHFGDYWWMIEEDFKQDPFKDYITEMLQSHDADKFMNMLQWQVFQKLDRRIRAYKLVDGNVTNVNIEVPNYVVGNYIIRDKDFQQLLFYFNYYVTRRDELTISLEPMKTDKINHFVFSNCCGIVYHITKRDNLKKILKQGLRPMADNDYRYFPKKIFLFATENFKFPKKRDEELKSMATAMDHTGSEYVVLQIKFTNSNINIYADKSKDYPGICYTFDDISPQIIKVYKDVDKL